MTSKDTSGEAPKYGAKVQIAALCVIIMQYVQSFVTPALSAVMKSYAGAGIDTVMIQQIQGIPSLMAIFGAILVGILERYMKKKHILIIAMILMFCGSLAAFVPETVAGFWVLLGTRVVLGLGRGMIFPMASSFIADLFTGRTRDRLMSYKTAVGGLSGAVFQIIGGMLAVLSWRYAFIGMLMAVPIALMIIFWLKEPQVKPAGTTESGEKGNPLKSINAASWFIIVLAGAWNIVQFTYFTNISLAIAGVGLGDTSVAGSISSLQTICCAVGAICYGSFIKGHLGGWDLLISCMLEIIGFFILTHFISLPGYIIGTIFHGIGFGIYNPALILQIVKVLPREGATLGLSLLAGSQNLFQFFSAYVMAFLAPLLSVAGEKGTPAASLANWNVAWMVGIVFLVILVVTIGIVKSKNPDMLYGTKADLKKVG